MSGPFKVIFFNPHSTSVGKEPLPISLLQLAAQLPEDVAWALVDGNFNQQPWQEILSKVDDPKRTLLATTVMPGPQLAQALPTCREVKARLPELPIIWGGYFPSQHHALVLGSGCVDHVALGPADVSFPQFVARARQGGNQPIRGILDADRPDQKTLKGAFVDPNHIPDLPYERIPMDRYLHRNYLGKRCICYHSSDGCPFFCSFCAVVALADGHWQGQTAERMLATLGHLQDRYRIDAVQFFDNNFFVSQRRCAAFARGLIEADRRLSWWGEGRIDTLLNFKQETLEDMHRAGLKMVFLGAETSDAETMELYQKGGTLTPQMTLELAERFGRIGIVPEFSFVLGNPTDTADAVARDFEFIRKVKAINPDAEIILYLYMPVVLPGDLSDAAQEAGFAYPDSLDGFLSDEWQMQEKRRGLRLPWNRGNHQVIREFETVLNAYYPTVTDTRLRQWQRKLLKLAAGWRFRLEVYRSPLELRALHKLFGYMRPETEGF